MLHKFLAKTPRDPRSFLLYNKVDFENLEKDLAFSLCDVTDRAASEARAVGRDRDARRNRVLEALVMSTIPAYGGPNNQDKDYSPHFAYSMLPPSYVRD